MNSCTTKAENLPQSRVVSSRSSTEGNGEKTLTHSVTETAQGQAHTTEKHSTEAEERSRHWCKVPRRYIFSVLSFVACSMSITFCTNLSVVIVAMVNRNASASPVHSSNECMGEIEEYVERKHGDFLWSPEEEGWAIGAVFYGQMVSAIPGGRLAEIWGGKKTLISLLLLASVLTLLLPVAAYASLYAFIAVRFLIGVGTGPVSAVLIYLISKWIPLKERSSCVSIVFAGYSIGIFVSSATAGALCNTDFLGGWPSVFYSGGATGLLWCVAYHFLVSETPLEHPTISDSELRHIMDGMPTKSAKKINTIPWKSMVTSLPMWALMLGHFGQLWILGIFFTVHTLYMGTILNLDIEKSGYLSCVPHLLRTVIAFLCGYPADWALRKGIVGLAFIRKGATIINTVFSTIGFVGIMLVGCDPVANTVFFIVGNLCAGFVIFGVMMGPADIAPNLTGTVSGILSVITMVSFSTVPATVGWATKYERTMKQWRWVYCITIGVAVVTTLIYVFFGSISPQPWGTSTEGEELEKGDSGDELKEIQETS